AELRELGREVVEDPLLVDLVVSDHAVGDDPRVHFAPGRWAPTPVPGVVADVEGAVRGDETLFVVTRPDDLVGIVTHVGKGIDSLNRAGDHLLDPMAWPAVVVHPARRC